MSSIDHKVKYGEGHEEHTSTSNWQTNPLPSSYGYLFDGKRWYRTSRKFGDIGGETNGMPYSKDVEKFIDNKSVREWKYRNAA